MELELEYRDVAPTDSFSRTVGEQSLRQVEAKVCSYNAAPDTYSTTWRSGVFSASLAKHLPVVCWAHDQRNVLGSVIGVREQPDGLYVRMQLADFDDVPEARKAYSLIRDGHIKGWSFGFANGQTQPDPNHRGALQFTKAALFEVSPVVRPSVPGTKTISVRSADDLEDDADEIYRLMCATNGARPVTRSVTVDDVDARLAKIIRRGRGLSSGEVSTTLRARAATRQRRDERLAREAVTDLARSQRTAQDQWAADNFETAARRREVIHIPVAPALLPPRPVYPPGSREEARLREVEAAIAKEWSARGVVEGPPQPQRPYDMPATYDEAVRRAFSQ